MKSQNGVFWMVQVYGWDFMDGMNYFLDGAVMDNT
jgi:hypothetical protein